MKKPITSQGVPLDKDKIYEALFIFIDNVLSVYRPSTCELGEDKITQDIEISLNDQAHNNDASFAFQNQSKIKNYRTDIGVYLRCSKSTFCEIEAKRLPTPRDNKRDEREYVIVNKDKGFDGNGGIQRFKESKHGRDLPYSIMFGYIQDGNDVDYWLLKINTWIMELANAENVFWSIEDRLKKYGFDHKNNRFLSIHKRKDKTTITLHHYWIKL